MALRHPGEYPIHEGHIVSSEGLDIAPEQYKRHFMEYRVPQSTALWSHLPGKPYLVGPLARLNLKWDRMPTPIQDVLSEAGISWPCRNMFKSIVARAIEVYLALQEVIRVLGDYEYPDAPAAPVMSRAGIGYGCTEAPRGILWHRYEVDERGIIVSAKIVPPTSQNQARIEEGLHRSLLAFGLDHGDDELRLHCEKVIRNYDPCISCATHFLRLTTERRCGDGGNPTS